MLRTRRGILSGLAFLAFGAAFAVGALSYPLGSTERMGPGFFPLLLGTFLAVVGVVLAVRPHETEDEPLARPSWRAMLFLLGGLLVFGLTVRGLGLLPSVFVTSLLAAFASRETGPPAALGMAVVLTAVSYLVFIVALQLPLPVLGPWIPRF